MKTTFKIFFLLTFTIFLNAQENPFNRGVNLTNWFQVGSPTEIHFTKYTKTDFENIKGLGADVIRLPINLHSMTLGAPDYELDPLFLSFLDQAVDWAEELDLNLLLDNHTFDVTVPTDPSIGNVLIPVWQNMAEHFKSRGEHVYYEILNEPHGIDDSTWNTIQGNVIDAIREVDTVHTIVVGPAGWNSYNNLHYMPEYDDDNLVYTFHFYDPFLFTHQGASWTDPSLAPLGGVPFPYNSSSMPAVPPELEGTWVASSLTSSYQSDGTISKVRELIDIAADFKEQRNVPIFCGEFGVYIPNAKNNDRVLWYSIVRSYLELKGLAWTSWDYHGGFGIFEESGYGMFEHDLNINLLRALGFNVPPQTDFELKPDTVGFGLYGDYLGENIVSAGNSGGTINFYNNDSYSGEYSISWANPTQYSSIAFGFTPIKDLSYLKQENYYVGFQLKGDNPLSRFQIRFLDTKENELDHPWRMSYTIDASKVIFDGTWQYVLIPLSAFEESGSWDNAWFEPQGLFDWSKIDRLEIVDEFGQLSSAQLWFDDIVVFDPNSTSVENNEIPINFELSQNYPNPFNPSTTINFTIPVLGRSGTSSYNTRLIVYDILGRKVATLVDQKLQPGEHEVIFNAAALASGMYFYKLNVGDKYSSNKKMLLLK